MSNRMEILYNKCMNLSIDKKITDEELADFAELVVLKCIQLCKEEPTASDAEIGITQCINRMKVHFNLDIDQ